MPQSLILDDFPVCRSTVWGRSKNSEGGHFRWSKASNVRKQKMNPRFGDGLRDTCMILWMVYCWVYHIKASHVWAPKSWLAFLEFLTPSSSAEAHPTAAFPEEWCTSRGWLQMFWCLQSQGDLPLQAVKHTVELLDAYGLRKEHLIEHLTELRQWVCPHAVISVSSWDQAWICFNRPWLLV